MDRIAFAYRSAVSRAGTAEPCVHATFLTYAILLFIATLLNILAPQWVSRNVVSSSLSTKISTTHPITSLPSLLDTDSNQVLDRSISRCLSRAFISDINNNPIVNRVRSELGCGCRVPDVYEPHETPTVCAIIQSFNHEMNIEKITHALINNPAIQEIIVCEDGSTDSSLDKWLEQLRDIKHFIVLSNNLHETRCYNRAMRMSSAEYFILMQDDDLPPAPATTESSQQKSSLNWVNHALELFDADPKLGVLSGFIGQLWDDKDNGYEFGEQNSDHGGTRKGKTNRIPFLSSRTIHPFMYVECGWIAPLFIRSEALHRFGGLDVGLFHVRQPGVWQDCVLSYAAWTAGWRVGVYDSGFQRGVGGHGSTSNPEKTKMRDTVWKRAKNAVDKRYDRTFIHQYVLSLNNHSLNTRYGSEDAATN